jgi:hypothetical protein
MIFSNGMGLLRILNLCFLKKCNRKLGKIDLLCFPMLISRLDKFQKEKKWGNQGLDREIA